ncbi:MAG: 3-mercaptopyruvate sulfurtransferase [Magnetovibrio sp.]|nr:3-mercaptopyruvate sulfurtransferase [Magnetovibrio sp.]
MEYVNPDALVSTEWLAENLDKTDLRIIDASSVLPNVDRNPYAEYLEKHIPGAQFFNINEIADTSDPLPHMLPSAQFFSLKMQKMGIGTGVKVIAYDTNGGSSASCRAWWMLRVFGHNDVAILNGGLPKWLAEQRPVENQRSVAIECDFKPHKNDFLVRDIEQMLANVDSKQEQVVDARSSGRFFGIDPEPRPSIKKGHIPGSLNLPYNLLMDTDNNFVFRSADEIIKVIEVAGIKPENPLVATCGSGVTACVIALALYLVGYKDTAVYDGSWAEWGDHPITPWVVDE